MKKLFLISLLIGANSFAVNRISSKIADLGKVHTIHMVPGMATVIEIPSAVTGIRVGNPDMIHYFQPESPDNEVTVILKAGNSLPTNMIIRSGKTKFVFDVIPSRATHQDTLEIIGSFGGPTLEGSKTELIASSSDGKKGGKK